MGSTQAVSKAGEVLVKGLQSEALSVASMPSTQLQNNLVPALESAARGLGGAGIRTAEAIADVGKNAGSGQPELMAMSLVMVAGGAIATSSLLAAAQPQPRSGPMRYAEPEMEPWSGQGPPGPWSRREPVRYSETDEWSRDVDDGAEFERPAPPPYPIDPRYGRGRGAFRRLPPPEQRGGRPGMVSDQWSGRRGGPRGFYDGAGRPAEMEGRVVPTARSLSPNRARERRNAAGRRAWLDGAPSDRADRAEAEARREARTRARPPDGPWLNGDAPDRFMSRGRFFAGRDDDAWYAGEIRRARSLGIEPSAGTEESNWYKRDAAARRASRFPPSGEYPHF